MNKKLIIISLIAATSFSLSPLSYGVGGIVYDPGSTLNNIRLDKNHNPFNFPSGTLIGGQPPGSVWRSGVGAPSNTLGSINDYYLDLTSGDVYFKGLAGTYSIITNIRGPQGVPGSLIVNGIIFSGTTSPRTKTLSDADDTILELHSFYPLTDKGGQVFNVKAYGVKGDGVTDDTAKINIAIAAVGSANSLYFPAGIYNTSGLHDLTGLNGLQIIGAGIGATIIRVTHATNDLFKWTSVTYDQTIANFSVTSDTVTRTGGWVAHVIGVPAHNSYLKRIHISNLDVKKQVNGLWIAQYEFVWLDHVNMAAFVGSGGIGIKAGQTTTSDLNQGSGLYISNSEVYSNDYTSGAAGSLGYGLIVEDADAAEVSASEFGGAAINNLKIIANTGGHAPANNFFRDTTFDATTSGHTVYATGGGTIINLQFQSCNFGSAGASGPTAGQSCFYSDVSNLAQGQIIGSHFANSTGAAIKLNGGHDDVVISGGNVIVANSGQDGININNVTNFQAVTIVGNSIGGGGSGGVAVRTSATSNGVNLGSNTFYNGVTLGTTPLNYTTVYGNFTATGSATASSLILPSSASTSITENWGMNLNGAAQQPIRIPNTGVVVGDTTFFSNGSSIPQGSIYAQGSVKVGHMADSAAANDTTYFSTTSNTLVYKDSGGTVHTLY